MSIASPAGTSPPSSSSLAASLPCLMVADMAQTLTRPPLAWSSDASFGDSRILTSRPSSFLSLATPDDCELWSEPLQFQALGQEGHWFHKLTGDVQINCGLHPLLQFLLVPSPKLLLSDLDVRDCPLDPRKRRRCRSPSTGQSRVLGDACQNDSLSRGHPAPSHLIDDDAPVCRVPPSPCHPPPCHA